MHRIVAEDLYKELTRGATKKGEEWTEGGEKGVSGEVRRQL